MNAQIQAAIGGFGDRMKSLAVYQPILNLANKNKYRELNLTSLGFSTLLFMLENMLLNKPTNTESLAHFYQQLLSETANIHLNTEEATELVGVLVDDYLRNNGNKHVFSFYNYEECKEDKFYFDLIVYDDDLSLYEISSSRLRKIKLSPLGVETLFKTKELFAELQISISQLYFKQQMIKGLFSEAMQAVKDLSLSIKNEITKMRELKIQIIQDAIAVSKRQELEEQLNRYADRIQTEREVFEDLKSVVKKTLDEYYSGKLTDKEEEGLTLILSIQKELLSVIGLHEQLFSEKQRLQSSMSNSLDSIILNAFSIKLNFEKDVLSEVIQQKTSLDGIHNILTPLLPIKKFSFFNPSQAFAIQRKSVIKQEREKEILELSEEEILRREAEEERIALEKEERQLLYIRTLLTPLISQDEVHFSAVMETLKSQDKYSFLELTDEPEFYSFIVDLHQAEYTQFKQIERENYYHAHTMARLLSRLIDEDELFEDIGYFTIVPLEETITFSSAKITDFIIKRGNAYVVAKK